MSATSPEDREFDFLGGSVGGSYADYGAPYPYRNTIDGRSSGLVDDAGSAGMGFRFDPNYGLTSIGIGAAYCIWSVAAI